MKSFVLTLAAAVVTAGALPAQTDKTTAEKSIVRVNVTSQAHNFMLPWQKRQPTSRDGLGALLKDNKVLVTAELIQDANYLEIELASSGRKLTAQAEIIDYEANLAILKPQEDPGDFFKDMEPLEIDRTPPKRGETFSVWQFETNGSPVSSEIRFEKAELGNYFLDGAYFLTFQAAGPVNYREGSFTLPVIHDGQLVGMLLTYDSKDQVAEILPFPIIRSFLEDAGDGTYDGFPSFGVKFAPTLDDQLRSYYKLDGKEGGVLITSVMPETSAALAGLKENDVLFEIGGHKVDARGNYMDETWGLLAIGHLVKGAAKVGDKLPMKVWRDGQETELTLALTRKAPASYLIDPYVFDRGPRYLIAGGLVFEELTQTYLESFGKDWRDRAPFKLSYAASNPEPFIAQGRRKLVFLAGVLPSESTLGYDGVGGALLDRVNGVEIKDIKDLDTALQSPKDGIHVFELDEVPYKLYLDAKQAQQDNEVLLPQRYRIRELKRLE